MIPHLKKKDILFALLIILFVSSRLWNITKTLEFFSDMGRDHYVLIRALQTRKPPLLGPSNSALPLNQSPIYYYLNFPVFILTHYSAFTTILTLLILFCLAFLVLYLWGEQRVFPLLLLSLFHPELFAQSRYAWNPTFTMPFLLVAIGLLLRPWPRTHNRTTDKSGNFVIQNSNTLRSDYRDSVLWGKEVWIFSICLAIAIGCSYSVVPTVAVCILYAIWKKKTKLKILLFSLTAALTAVFLPLMVVELRTHFLITKRLIMEAGVVGAGMNVTEKFKALSAYIVGVQPGTLFPIVVLGILFFFALRERPRPRFLLLWIASMLATVLSPFPFAPHYIFGVTALFFFVLAGIRRTLFVPLFLILLFLWFPQVKKQLDTPIHRTVVQMENCARQVCEKEKNPIYISEQAWHSYHFAPDWLFMLSKHGCQVADVTTTPNFSNRMDVILDSSSFEFGKTAYNELTLFGPSRMGTTLMCAGNIQVVQLEKL